MQSLLSSNLHLKKPKKNPAEAGFNVPAP